MGPTNEQQKLLQLYLSVHVIQQKDAGVLTYFSHLSNQIHFCFNYSTYCCYEQHCRAKDLYTTFPRYKTDPITYDKNRWQRAANRSCNGYYCFFLFQIQSGVQNVTPLPVQKDHTLLTFILPWWVLKFSIWFMRN